MKILHGTWIPDAETGFIQGGGFYLWVETAEEQIKQRSKSNLHPRHLTQKNLVACLTQELGVKPDPYRPLEDEIVSRSFLLPTAEAQPLPSLELARYLEQDIPAQFEFAYWQVDCYAVNAWVKVGSDGKVPVTNVTKQLNELHFIALHNLADVQLGTDLLFWYHYTQAFKHLILRDHYIPALKYRALSASSTAKRNSRTQSQPTQATQFELYPAWEIISETYEADLQRYVDYMPLACVTGFAQPFDEPEFYDRESLLRHFSEHLLTEIVTRTPVTASFEKQVTNTLIADCLGALEDRPWKNNGLDLYQQWRAWRDRIRHTQTTVPFYLCFQLQDPEQADAPWQLQFLVTPKQDPSLQIALEDYWRSRPNRRQELQTQFGESFEQHLLLSLGYAARIYPKLWSGLETDQPSGIALNIDTAFEFLQESAWVLEDAGYKVIIPAWWTPKGR